MYNKTRSQAVTNRPCIQARYPIQFLSPLKCGLWRGEGFVLVINAPKGKEVAQEFFFWGGREEGGKEVTDLMFMMEL